MSGLDKVIESIIAEANMNASRIINEAETECERIKAESKAECDAIKNEAAEKNDKKEAQLKESALSTSRLVKKQEMLRAKRRVIDTVTEKVKEKLYSLDDKEYFNTLYRLMEKNIHEDEKGEIILNAKDKKRIPENFSEKLSGCGLALAKDSADIKGGFILRYGGIEENCSFDAVIDSASEEITDIVSSELFR